jgi:DnaJ-class molecular chaperone
MSHYTVLNVSPSATLYDIKQQYVSLSKEHHPDVNLNSEAAQTFMKIQNAWEVLRHETTRKQYDKELSHQRNEAKRRTGEISDIVSVSNMELDEETGELWYPCRCSNRYQIDSTLLEDGVDIIVVCSGCSLKIKVENDL